MACKDFIEPGVQFVPFNDVGESTLDQDKERYQYSYEDIMKMLEDNSKLTQVQETISSFWEIYIVDALLGNLDRHGSNWGFISEIHKRLYKHMLEARYSLIIKSTYDLLEKDYI